MLLSAIMELPKLIFLIISIYSGTAQSATDYRSAHKMLSDYLTGATQSDDIIVNLDIVQDFLDKKQQGGYLSSLFKKGDHNLELAMERLVSLRGVIESESEIERCSEESLEALRKSNILTSSSACRQHIETPNDRVESIIYRCALRHAKQCRNFYKQNYGLSEERVPKVHLERVDKLIELVLGSVYGDEEIYQQDKRLADLETLLFKHEHTFEYGFGSRIGHVFVKMYSLEHGNELAKVKIERELEIYERACYNYTFNMEPLFRPLEFDEKTWPLEATDDFKFRYTYAKYRICQKFLSTYPRIQLQVNSIVHKVDQLSSLM